MNSFAITCTCGNARTGILSTPHGSVETPEFMPVGTQATVKAMTPDELQEIGTRIILANAYHLYLRPGHDLIARAGGLHSFMRWSGPILSDSGGYQIFSLPGLTRVSDEGVTFRSHIDGSTHVLTPEKVLQIQEALGVDIAMMFDQPVGYPATHEQARVALERTLLWAKRLSVRRTLTSQLVFGIVQGGFDETLRAESASHTVAIGFDGYAIGGLSVGEPPETTWRLTEVVTRVLPEEQPRYLMGVGHPNDILDAVGLGVDLFDCVLPTRLGRNGSAYTNRGRINLKNAQYAEDFRPLDEECGCRVCARFTRAYMRHLYKAGEILAARLVTYHNLSFYLDFMRRIRAAIRADRLSEFREEFLLRWSKDNSCTT